DLMTHHHVEVGGRFARDGREALVPPGPALVDGLGRVGAAGVDPRQIPARREEALHQRALERGQQVHGRPSCRQGRFPRHLATRRAGGLADAQVGHWAPSHLRPSSRICAWSNASASRSTFVTWTQAALEASSPPFTSGGGPSSFVTYARLIVRPRGSRPTASYTPSSAIGPSCSIPV